MFLCEFLNKVLIDLVWVIWLLLYRGGGIVRYKGIII